MTLFDYKVYLIGMAAITVGVIVASIIRFFTTK